MKKLNLSQKNSLKRVLSVDEMKSIFGGMNASITCTCKLFIKKAGSLEYEERKDEPTGEFNTESLCKSACDATCATTVNCEKATYDYAKSGGYGSGSGSGPESK